MKPNFKQMEIKDIAAFICQELMDIDVKTTLSGGFCVEIYSHGEYTSMDIDLIDQSIFKQRQIDAKMKELGFVKNGKNYKHTDITYTVEFPASPLAIGQELVKEINEIKTEYGVLRIITPTDCIKDRLCGYYYFKDERSLKQAILVALHNDSIDYDNIAAWSEKEGEIQKYQLFWETLQKRV